MNQRFKKPWYLLSTMILSGLFLAGCSSSDPSSPPVLTPMATYEVTIVNATNHQPMSPVVVVAHGTSFSIWKVGTAASNELEYLAEGGSTSQLVDSLMLEESATGAGPIGPGGNETIKLETFIGHSMISVATMLVNTNDAFTGVQAIDVSGMEIGDSLTFSANAYDAGTEANSEATATMPGPVEVGGEGFNVARNDLNLVTIHRGVVTVDDGLATSVLDESHRFDNTVMMVTISRI
jgi:hypothetical protein